jgi:hypothetical protein
MIFNYVNFNKKIIKRYVILRRSEKKSGIRFKVVARSRHIRKKFWIESVDPPKKLDRIGSVDSPKKMDRIGRVPKKLDRIGSKNPIIFLIFSKYFLKDEVKK